ncbi:hypothetical protein MAPG_08037 [Magnaporthiopsis poae ATCC 64411]|uniref:ADF-H domain-containing protein n=1 Tax=Magnaporthiopsis poae (strain ATCC 64411 / 73-15) TaxID=644358 RepID=A0A0C4E6A6_MAGP6|nr:hypothetical protein MAPG_08037 [Magnaporthiopsis poae ATCC 64411]
MSLNGLDALELKEAHDAAAAEPGGWFLLRYAGRDAVELLGKGSGGIVEIRNAIAQYEEPSPLYGFLRYRRRNVIIKYLPDNCSRLVQARVSVHLDSVCERFSPHDTVFEIAEAKDLKDTRLSAACSLHTASGSMSSSTSSLRRRRLMEIAEEEEEEQRATKRQSIGAADEADRPSSPAEPPVALDPSLAASPEASQFSGAAEPPAFVGAPRPVSPARSLDASGSGSFLPGQSDYSGYHSSSPFSARPKVKLGPRPSLDTSGRPRTAAGSAFRPISTIPAGLKMMSKTGKKDKLQGADEGQGDTDGLDDSIGETPAVSSLQARDLASMEHLAAPDVHGAPPPRPHTSGGRSTVATAGVKAAPAATAKPGPTGPGMMSPEKSRLMKAMQLREKKKKEQEALIASTGDITSGGDDSPSAADTSDIALSRLDDAVDEPSSLAECLEQDQAVSQAKDLAETSGIAGDQQVALGSRDETTEEVASHPLPDRASVDAQTDSHPPSPLVASSEIGNSTKASSVSESTNETALESKGGAAESTTEPDDERPRTATPAAAAEEGSGDTSMEPQQPGQSEEMASTMLNIANAPCAETGGAHADASTSATTGQEGILGHTEDGLGNADSGHVPGQPPSALEAPLLKTPTYNFSDVSRAEQQPKATVESPRGSIDASRTPIGDEPGSAAGLKPDSAQAEPESNGPRRLKAAGVEPIRVGLVANTTAAIDDEDLMDEMQSATLHEARPVSMSKSPITPVFPLSDVGSPGDDSPSPMANVSGTDGPGAATAPARNATRAVSNPTSNGRSAGASDAPPLQPPSIRAASSGPAFLQMVSQQRPGSSSSVASAPGTTPSKKIGMGSSISQRIKALEKLSSSSGGLSTPGSVTERPQSAFFLVRPSSVREPSRSPSVLDRASSLRVEKNTPPPPQPQDREGSLAATACLRERSGSISSRLSVFEGGSVPRGRPESIQVTARIVRDPLRSLQKAAEPPRADVAEPVVLDLKQSPLVVDHHRPTSPLSGIRDVTTEPRKSTILQRRLSRDQRRSQAAGGDDGVVVDINNADAEATAEDSPRRRSSMTIVRDFIKDRRSSVRGARSPSTDNLSASPNPAASPSRSPSRPPSTQHNSVFPRRLSISSRRSSMSKDRDGVVTPLLSPTRTAETSGSGDEATGRMGGSDGQKKSGSGSKSRASRFIRRLSNSLSSSRKAVTQIRSPTVTEEVCDGEAGHSMGGQQQKQPAVVADMGDVNVQFPDNLLWKRRAMCLDSQGFLVLSAGQAAAAAGSVVTKRYHLSEFRNPYAPEMEQQELPNSVCLDFVDGSSLQIACEDRAGQLSTLQQLQAAHQSHTTFGQ